MAARRADRLANLEKNASATSNITEQNKNESPLLRLPAEIRNRIYGFALGGQHIRLFFSHLRLCRSVCVAVKSEREVAHAFIAKDSPDKKLAPKDVHASCKLHGILAADPALLALQLPVVCREINHEAALLPFQTKTFVCGEFRGYGGPLDTFAVRLIPAQRKKVTSISISPLTYAGYKRMPTFTGLQHLTIFGALLDRPYNAILARMLLFPDYILKCLNFRGWKSAVICVLDEDLDTDQPKASKDFEQLARVWEKRLTVPWDPQAIQADLAAERKASLRESKVQSHRV